MFGFPYALTIREAFTLWLVLVTATGVHAADEFAERPTLVRAINLNGPSMEIDGQVWDSEGIPDFEVEANQFDNPNVPLLPPVQGNWAKMLQSSRWGGNARLKWSNLPAGEYQIVLYVWEDNAPTKYSIAINDAIVLADFESGLAGHWHRLGPFPTVVQNGELSISTSGGDANLSGVELWRGGGELPTVEIRSAGKKATDDELAFFESRIRPLLINHCYDCHSSQAKELGGGLLLDSKAGWQTGGDNGPAMVPGSPDRSLLMIAVDHTISELSMPPEGKLSEQELNDLRSWILQGAPDPRTENSVSERLAKQAIDWDKVREFWSLRPVATVEAPQVKNVDWPRTTIDQFILAKMEANELAPSVDADRRVLLRRAKFDLLGLPPTPQEFDQFLNDSSPGAFGRAVDRYLESPQYGERWGRHWLDVVRYSDTAGDNADFPIPQMYLYRNWVINAINADMPYDQFVREQLAGDLLGGTTKEIQNQRLFATGYIANARRFGSRVDDYPQHLTIEDTLDNLGRAFLASSLNCARCHNHKFDPITTEDYYALYGIFNSTRYPWPGIELQQHQRDLVPLVDASVFDQVMAERKKKQKELDDENQRITKLRDAAEGQARVELDKLQDEAEDRARSHAGLELPFPVAYAVQDAAKRGDVAVQIKGDPNKLGPEVSRRFLKVLGGQPLPSNDSSSGRLQLADWIVDPNNPLTSRVMVNRIWLNHFGKGLVETPNDFGRQGKPPTHPELLDWLAAQFIQSGWSIKAMHRLIMASRTYQLSSVRSDASLERDPNNQWLTSYPQRRLDAESLRDTLLFLGGNIDFTQGGPHPFPPQPEWRFTQHNPFKAIYDTRRRSVYLMTQRIQRHPFLAIFDGADPSASTARRLTSTTPLQSLYFLNDPFVHEQAALFAKRAIESSLVFEEQVQFLFVQSIGRPASDEELGILKSALPRLETAFRESGLQDDQIEFQVWQSIVRSMFRLNEFVYLE